MDSTTLLQILGGSIFGAIVGAIGTYVYFRVTLERRLTTIEGEIGFIKPLKEMLLRFGSDHMIKVFERGK